MLPVRLVLLDTAVEKSKTEALGQSTRVSAVALTEGCGGDTRPSISKGFQDQMLVKSLDVLWLREAAEANWQARR